MYILDNKIYAEYGNIPESILLSKTNSTLYWIDDGEDLSKEIPYNGKQLDGREYVDGKMKEDVWIIGHPILESPPHPVYITISRLPGTIDYEFKSSSKEQAKEEAKKEALEYLEELKKVSGAYASNADIYCRPKGTNSFKINRK